VFSNAALQWIPDHPRLIPRLWSWVAPRGALAFQVPAPGPERARWADAVEAAVAHSAPAASSASDASDAPVRPLSDYYAFLRAGARQIELWDTLYVHVLPDARAIVEWLQGTALRPQLALLPEPAERERFLAAVADEVARRYAPSPDGTVLFPFLRRFVIAYRG
jgi:trans-aconitate 2-methyltransferase